MPMVRVNQLFRLLLVMALVTADGGGARAASRRSSTSARLPVVIRERATVASGVNVSSIWVIPPSSTRGCAGNGSHANPFTCLSAAQSAVRRLVASGLRASVVVHLSNGAYYLNETLGFDARDSGTADHSVRWTAPPGCGVVLLGGRSSQPSLSWSRQRRSDGLVVFESTVVRQLLSHDTLASGKVDQHQRHQHQQRPSTLYTVDEAGRQRRVNPSRIPSTGFLRTTGVVMTAPAGCVQLLFDASPSLVPRFRVTAQTRALVWATDYVTNILPIKSVDWTRGVLTLVGALTYFPPFLKQGHPGTLFAVLGASEVFEIPARNSSDANGTAASSMWPVPNSFAISPRNTLLLRPPDSSSEPPAAIFIPHLQQVLSIAGEQAHSVQNLHFHGITVTGTAVPDAVVPDAHLAVASEFAVAVSNATNFSFSDVWLAQLGNGGMFVGPDCRNGAFVSSAITNVGTRPAVFASNGMNVTDNYIAFNGEISPGSWGLSISRHRNSGHATDLRVSVEHCLVHNMSYHGIQAAGIGDPNGTSPTTIAFNRVYNLRDISIPT
jgi:hypothetical protein